MYFQSALRRAQRGNSISSACSACSACPCDAPVQRKLLTSGKSSKSTMVIIGWQGQGFRSCWYAGAGVLLLLATNTSSWCWKTSKKSAKYQQILYFLFFSEKIFLKYYFLLNICFWVTWERNRTFISMFYLYQLGPKKSHFWLKTAKIQNFQFF